LHRFSGRYADLDPQPATQPVKIKMSKPQDTRRLKLTPTVDRTET